jgi:transcriptional regulator with XRE-family HTH domain
VPAELPPPTAWGKLIRLRREAMGLSIPAAAKRAGVSRYTWRNIEIGYQVLSGGRGVTGAPGKDGTVAHMADVVGISPERLHSLGRPDAADVLRTIITMRTPAEPSESERLAEWAGGQLLGAGFDPAEVSEFLEAENLPGDQPMTVDFYRRLARMLNRPVMEVLIGSGAVTPDDMSARDTRRRADGPRSGRQERRA